MSDPMDAAMYVLKNEEPAPEPYVPPRQTGKGPMGRTTQRNLGMGGTTGPIHPEMPYGAGVNSDEDDTDPYHAEPVEYTPEMWAEKHANMPPSAPTPFDDLDTTEAEEPLDLAEDGESDKHRLPMPPQRQGELEPMTDPRMKRASTPMDAAWALLKSFY